MEEEESLNQYYVVRGARIYCECGSHTGHLNLSKDHGVYVNGRPMIHMGDSKAGVNIGDFGVCYSTVEQPDTKTVLLVSEDGESNVKGKGCKPEIIGNWQDIYPVTQLLEEGESSGFDKKAVLTCSYLVCKYGGIIRFIDSGQDFEG